MNQKILICKKVKFYSEKDREACCDWLKKITCIHDIEVFEKDFYLKLSKRVLNFTELDNLIGIFYRYKIDLKQLAQFVNTKNRKWFYDNKVAFWHKKMFTNNDPFLKGPKNAKK